MKRLQDVTTEKVVANLGGSSFMTESGLVIEGNYQVGENAPVIFDKDSLRYLAAYKSRGDLPDFEEIRHDEALVDQFYPPINAGPVMVTHRNEWAPEDPEYSYRYKIFFTCAKKAPEDPDLHFYIDLEEAFIENNHYDSHNTFYALQVIEYKPYMGAIIYFRGWKEVIIEGNPTNVRTMDDCHVIKFKVTTRVVPTQEFIFEEKPYKKCNYEYSIESFSLRDEDLPFPSINVYHGIPSHPVETWGRRYTEYMDDWMHASGYDEYGRWNRYTFPETIKSEGSEGYRDWTLQIPFATTCWIDDESSPLEFTMTVKYTQYGIGISNPTVAIYPYDYYQKRVITPIGFGVWLAQRGSESLVNLKWEVRLSAEVKYMYHWKFGNSWEGNPGSCGIFDILETMISQYGDPGMKWLTYDSWFFVPTMFARRSGENIRHVDIQGVTEPWAFDNGFLPLWKGSITYQTSVWEERVVPDDPASMFMFGTWYLPINPYRPGRHIRAWPVYNNTGVLMDFMVHYVELNGDMEEQWLYTPSGKFHVSGADREFDINLTLPPGFTYSPFYPMPLSELHKPHRYNLKHPGGGISGRHMCRIAASPVNKNRSVYVVEGSMFDEGNDGFDLSPLKYPFGRSSKELVLADKMLDVDTGVAVLNSEIAGGFHIMSLSAKYADYLELVASTESRFNEYEIGCQVMNDFGIVNMEFIEKIHE